VEKRGLHRKISRKQKDHQLEKDHQLKHVVSTTKNGRQEVVQPLRTCEKGSRIGRFSDLQEIPPIGFALCQAAQSVPSETATNPGMHTD
jgi:hypothetical protein